MSRRIMDSFSEAVLSSTWLPKHPNRPIQPNVESTPHALSPRNYILTDLKIKN